MTSEQLAEIIEPARLDRSNRLDLGGYKLTVLTERMRNFTNLTMLKLAGKQQVCTT